MSWLVEAFCLCVVYYEVTDLRKKRHPIKDLVLKRFIQEIMSLELIFTWNLTIAVMIGCILLVHCEITDLRKRMHSSKKLQCQLAGRDDLQSKSVLKPCFLHMNWLSPSWLEAFCFIYCEIAATSMSTFSYVLLTVQFTFLGLNE